MTMKGGYDLAVIGAMPGRNRRRDHSRVSGGQGRTHRSVRRPRWGRCEHWHSAKQDSARIKAQCSANYEGTGRSEDVGVLMRSYDLLDADGAGGTSFDSAELPPQYGSNAPAG
jgi:hypothetical protein